MVAIVSEALSGMEITEENLENARAIGEKALTVAIRAGALGPQYSKLHKETIESITNIGVMAVVCVANTNDLTGKERIALIESTLMREGLPIAVDLVMVRVPASKKLREFVYEKATNAADNLADRIWEEEAGTPGAAGILRGTPAGGNAAGAESDVQEVQVIA